MAWRKPEDNANQGISDGQTSMALHGTDATPDYLELSPGLAAQIELDRRNHWVNPARFDDADVVRRIDNPHDRATITRTAFGRDIEKIMNLPVYNRYTDKTQVFSFQKDDDLSRRALHVQLVSRISRNIGAVLGLNVDLIEAIAIAHDIGHTPFGHVGERFLSKLLEEHTGRHFEHNVHSVRVLDHLYQRNISLQTLDGALCHNGEFAQQELVRGSCSSFDVLDANVEACYTEGGPAIKSMRPSTLEGCVVRVCDMVAYLGKDRQDAREMGVINGMKFSSSYIGTDNAQIINNLTVDIIENSYRKDHIAMSRAGFNDIKLAKDQNYAFIYQNEGVSASYNDAIYPMFKELYEKLLEDVVQRNTDSPIFRHHIHSICKYSRNFSEEEYLADDPNQIVVDYLASMTDSYFIDLYEFMFPNGQHHIAYTGYFDKLS